MVRRPPPAELGVHDLVGIGFGPSNIALAIAIEEHNATVPAAAALRCIFLEKQPSFSWHRGMLLDGATMQVSYLKDLVTLRNPASDYSFLSYLHCQDRLIDFVNHKTMYPLRHEFHDYLEWAAGRLANLVEYGTEVIGLRPVLRGGEVAYVDVVSRPSGSDESGALVVRRARNVVLAAGLAPYVPDDYTLDERIWHNNELLFHIERMPALSHGRFVVLGAGQSAAEVTEYLHTNYPTAEVCTVFSRYGFTPADSSPFVNQIFDPAAVDDFFAASPDVRRMLIDYHRGTNYSAVDGDLIDSLYRRVYQERVRGPQRLRILRTSRVVTHERLADGVRLTVESHTTGERQVLDADILVLATGYRPRDPRVLLDGLGDVCALDTEGRPRVNRDYSVVTTASTTAGIYIPGATEYSHGISSTLLSNVAVRAGEILSSILARDPETGLSGDPVVPRPATKPAWVA